MNDKIIPLSIEGYRGLYAGFGLRLGSMLLDILIMLPVGFIILFANSQSLEMHWLTMFFNLLLGIFYNIYLPKRYGGTPGKLIAASRSSSSTAMTSAGRKPSCATV